MLPANRPLSEGAAQRHRYRPDRQTRQPIDARHCKVRGPLRLYAVTVAGWNPLNHELSRYAMTSAADLKRAVCDTVDAMRVELIGVSRAIHAEPELAFRE